jgi:hypothetical protein
MIGACDQGDAGLIPLEHVPEKWTRFSDKDMLQVFELARILFDQVIPPDRKARKAHDGSAQ